MSFLGAISSLFPNEDGTPNQGQRIAEAFKSPQEQYQQLQMQQLLTEQQKKQQAQTVLQEWAKLPEKERNPKALYGALAATTGDATYLKQFTDMTTPKPKYTQMGGNMVMTDENNPSAKPKVVYSQPTADERKLDTAEKTKVEGKSKIEQTLKETLNDYLKMAESGNAVIPGASPLQNLGPAFRTSYVGQRVGKNLGTESQSQLDTIKNKRPILINAIRQATGMSAKSMDSNSELQFYLSAVSNPESADLLSNLKALASVSDAYGAGSLKDDPEYQAALKAASSKLSSKTPLQQMAAPKRVVKFGDLAQ